MPSLDKRHVILISDKASSLLEKNFLTIGKTRVDVFIYERYIIHIQKLYKDRNVFRNSKIFIKNVC